MPTAVILQPPPTTASADEIRYCRLCKKEIVANSHFEIPEYCCSGCEAVDRLMKTSGWGGLKSEPRARQAEFVKWNESADAHRGRVQLYIEGIHCSSCLWILERLPHLFPTEVQSAQLQLSQGILELILVPGAKLDSVAQKIQALGYRPHLLDQPAQAAILAQQENRNRLVDVGIAGALAGNVMLMSIPLYSGVEGPIQKLFEWLSLALAIPSVFYSGRSFFTNVIGGIRSKVFPIDGPILLAILVAFFYSAVSVFRGTHELYFDSLTTLVFLLLSSRYYLARLRQSSKNSLGILDFFQAGTSEKVGDQVSIQGLDRIRVDGVLRSGEVFLDLSHFSGESVPVKVSVGGQIFAGTQVIEVSEGAVMEVTAVGASTRMAQLLNRVHEAQTRRASSELSSDRWARVLLGVVTSIALVASVYFAWIGRTGEGLTRVLALLIVTCPCALALATPLVFALSMKRLIRKGILLKDPEVLDRVLDVKKIYFDKTGTLTWGQLRVLNDVAAYSPEIRSVLYSMATRSRHPVSRAIEFALQGTPGLRLISFAHFDEIPGVGLRAVDEEGAEFRLERAHHNQSGHTEVVLLRSAGSLSAQTPWAQIQLADQIRPESAPTIQKLKSMGYQLALLSGDAQGPAESMAQQAGLNTVYFEQTPDSKAVRVQDSMMVGDGLNDALALSKARVSIAVQGGIDAAIQSAQVYSMIPGIQTLPTLIETAERVKRSLRQNFIFSTSYNVLGGVLALTGLMNPLVAAILMPLSATTVFIATLYRFRERAFQERT